MVDILKYIWVYYYFCLLFFVPEGKMCLNPSDQNYIYKGKVSLGFIPNACEILTALLQFQDCKPDILIK